MCVCVSVCVCVFVCLSCCSITPLTERQWHGCPSSSTRYSNDDPVNTQRQRAELWRKLPQNFHRKDNSFNCFYHHLFRMEITRMTRTFHPLRVMRVRHSEPEHWQDEKTEKPLEGKTFESNSEWTKEIERKKERERKRQSVCVWLRESDARVWERARER